MSQQFHIASHSAALAEHGLTDLASVRAFSGTPLKVQRGRRDVFRLTSTAEGHEDVLFLKRILKPYRKHAIESLLRYGRLVSTAEVEAASLDELRSLGVATPRCVAVGAEFGPLGETFSFLITEAAPGVPLDQWLAGRPPASEVRQVGTALMRLLRRVHEARIGLPTLMARHVFVDMDRRAPRLTLIDVDRLARPSHMRWQRIRDLAQLHFSIPLAHLPIGERIRMLRVYVAGERASGRSLLRDIARRTAYLLHRRRRRSAEFLAGLSAVQAARVRAAARARRAFRRLALGADAAVGIAGAGLLWLAYVLARRDLFPLDEAHEWQALADHLDDAAPHLPLSDWLLSPLGLLGLALVVAALIRARNALLERS